MLDKGRRPERTVRVPGRHRRSAGRLDPEQWRAPTELPGWTVHDVVAHVIGTEMMLSGTLPPDIDVAGRGHVHNEIGALNERWVEHLRSKSPRRCWRSSATWPHGAKAALMAMTPGREHRHHDPAGPDSYGRFWRGPGVRLLGA